MSLQVAVREELWGGEIKQASASALGLCCFSTEHWLREHRRGTSGVQGVLDTNLREGADRRAGV